MERMQNNFILADGRWSGQHGIGRFSHEILSRLNHADILTQGPAPLAIKNLFWQSYFLARKQPYKIFFNPGFNPVWFSSIPFVFTLHDIIPLQLKTSHFSKKIKIFFEFFIKPATKKAYKIITVSEHSKKTILEWTHLPTEKVIVAGCGVSEFFSPQGLPYQPGFPYLLHIGNTKEHKNVYRLIQAFAYANLAKEIKLICTGTLTPAIKTLIAKLNLQKRVIAHTHLSEQQLASYYRGALGIVFPSLYEGFGLPVIEGMASGVPVLTSTVTSLPEIAGDAAILVDPYQISDIAEGIKQLVNNTPLRTELICKGLARAKLFSWNKSAQTIQAILDSA